MLNLLTNINHNFLENRIIHQTDVCDSKNFNNNENNVNIVLEKLNSLKINNNFISNLSFKNYNNQYNEDRINYKL